jgi:hypothetical protein
MLEDRLDRPREKGGFEGFDRWLAWSDDLDGNFCL